MTPEQCRAARGWLDLSQDELAKSAKVSQSTVRDFEAGRRNPIANNLEAMKRELEAKGMRFRNSQDGKAEGLDWTDSKKPA